MLLHSPQAVTFLSAGLAMVLIMIKILLIMNVTAYGAGIKTLFLGPDRRGRSAPRTLFAGGKVVSLSASDNVYIHYILPCEKLQVFFSFWRSICFLSSLFRFATPSPLRFSALLPQPRASAPRRKGSMMQIDRHDTRNDARNQSEQQFKQNGPVPIEAARHQRKDDIRTGD